MKKVQKPRKKNSGKVTANQEMVSRLEVFFESIPPNEFRESLLEIYLSYIRHEHESLPYNFRELAESMGMFLDFLKFVDEELKVDGEVKHFEHLKRL